MTRAADLVASPHLVAGATVRDDLTSGFVDERLVRLHLHLGF